MQAQSGLAVGQDTRMHEPSWTDQIAIYSAFIFAWFTGEAGRAALAGAAGGLVRWLVAERRRLRDGAASVIIGLFMARYATPLVVPILEANFGNMRGDVQGMAGFAAGIAGMSAVKMFMAIIEARARRLTDKEGSDA